MTNIFFTGIDFEDMRRMMELIDLAAPDTDTYKIEYFIHIRETEVGTFWSILIDNETNILNDIIEKTVSALVFDNMCGILKNGITMQISLEDGRILDFNFDGTFVNFEKIKSAIGM